MSSDDLEERGKQVKKVGEPIPVRTTQEVARPDFVSRAVKTSGILIGYGLVQVATMVSDFTNGLELGMIAGRQSSRWQRTRLQKGNEMQAIVVEEEKKVEID